jgi:hypothetical protein
MIAEAAPKPHIGARPGSDVHYVPPRLADPSGGCRDAIVVGVAEDDDIMAWLCIGGRPHRDIGPMRQDERCLQSPAVWNDDTSGYPERTWHQAETCKAAP